MRLIQRSYIEFLLSVLAGIAALAYLGQDSPSADIVALLGAVAVVAFHAKARVRLDGSFILEPCIALLAVYAIWHFAFWIVFYLGVASSYRLPGYLDLTPGYGTSALFLSLSGLLALSSGMKAGRGHRAWRPISGNRSLVKVFGILAISGSALIVLYLAIAGYKVVGDYSLVFTENDPFRRVYNLGVLCLLVALGPYFAFSRRSWPREAVLLALLLPGLLATMVLGSRWVVASCLLAVVMARSVSGRPLRLWTLVSLSILGLAVGILVKDFRAGGTTISITDQLLNRHTSPIVEAAEELGQAFQAVSVTISMYDGAELEFGKTFVPALLSVFPSGNHFFPVDVVRPSELIAQRFFYRRFIEEGYNLGFSLPAELYMNFSILGVVIGMWLFGLTIGKLTRMASGTSSDLAAIWLLGVTTVMLFGIRNDSVTLDAIPCLGTHVGEHHRGGRSGVQAVFKAPGRSTLNPVRLIYISPEFPKVRHGFELTELVCLEASADIDLCVVSLRRPTPGAWSWLKSGIETYGPVPEIVSASGTSVLPLLKDPMALFRGFKASVVLIFGAAIRSGPKSTIKVALSCVLGFVVAGTARRRSTQWLHADFASAPATVAFVAARIAKLPYSFMGHAIDVFSNVPAGGGTRWLLQQKRSHAAAVFAGSEAALTVLDSDLEPQVQLKRNGVLSQRIEPSVARRGDIPNRVVCLGAQVPKKGLDLVIKAAALVKNRGIDLEVHFHGDGPEQARLRGLALQLDIPTKFHEPFSPGELPEIFREASFACLGSRTLESGDSDGVPTVLIEALLHRCPVIGTRVGGIAELIRHNETGLLVPPDDPEALGNAMHRLISDVGLAQRLAFQGREFVLDTFDARASTHVLVQEVLSKVGP